MAQVLRFVPRLSAAGAPVERRGKLLHLQLASDAPTVQRKVDANAQAQRHTARLCDRHPHVGALLRALISDALWHRFVTDERAGLVAVTLADAIVALDVRDLTSPELRSVARQCTWELARHGVATMVDCDWLRLRECHERFRRPVLHALGVGDADAKDFMSLDSQWRACDAMCAAAQLGTEIQLRERIVRSRRHSR